MAAASSLVRRRFFLTHSWPVGKLTFFSRSTPRANGLCEPQVAGFLPPPCVSNARREPSRAARASSAQLAANTEADSPLDDHGASQRMLRRRVSTEAGPQRTRRGHSGGVTASWCAHGRCAFPPSRPAWFVPVRLGPASITLGRSTLCLWLLHGQQPTSIFTSTWPHWLTFVRELLLLAQGKPREADERTKQASLAPGDGQARGGRAGSAPRENEGPSETTKTTRTGSLHYTAVVACGKGPAAGGATLTKCYEASGPTGGGGNNEPRQKQQTFLLGTVWAARAVGRDSERASVARMVVAAGPRRRRSLANETERKRTSNSAHKTNGSDPAAAATNEQAKNCVCVCARASCFPSFVRLPPVRGWRRWLKNIVPECEK